ncbi:hypothetical protein POF50_029130 [Streptomyces sp. SL13]|uniref:Thiaminase-2/PQQC domain-containing protein n=1 Tax=Streptantibioticus silvisoli TaxID=2705255 RepID=A0AA90H926_9ACTN|nr:hypothetical protein [Streptantibioticus silvisoli]MDI5973360.1 hypothetical protein [Streptantibioticus silvisoli]
MTTLRRTVPFVARSGKDHSARILLVDRAELPLAAAGDAQLSATLRRPISLGPADQGIPADEVEQLVEEQYQAALEFVYGHPVWQRIREGEALGAVRAYLMESRHYLAAAPFRMASGITDALRPSELVRLQAHHVVEEADHDTYFENGLAALDIPRDLVRQARPSPVTVEWIHLMRTVAAYGPLAAALCSGLLEYTAGDQKSVAGWHTMLHERGMLPKEAVEAIFEHVETDLGLGHGNNWRDAVRAAKVVPAAELADWLNAVTLVAEMIVRWLETFEAGLSSETVAASPGLQLEGAAPVLGGEADGLPVWPAEIYASYAHGPRSTASGVRRVLALSYAYSGRAVQHGATGNSTTAVASDLVGRTAREWDGRTDEVGLEKLVESWMVAIDGHALWQRMTEDPTLPLVHGYMVENYHYVAGIWQHTGGAVAACPDPVIRNELVKHLIEEFNHGKMFLRGIKKARGSRDHGLTPDRMRPLATTVAFVGTLRELAQRDWKAYVLALAYLQLTLSAAGTTVHSRHEDFYRTLFDRLPESEQLVSAMRTHDAEDTRLGHGDDTRDLLRLLAQRHTITRESVAAAALVPQLAWSFLDGILQHYRHGEAAVLQRAGWHVEG